jgi:hypothetical protein
MKRFLVFMFAVALSVTAAWCRPGDSAHAMGMVSVKGGRAIHPVHLPGGKDRYTLVLTGTILPPYQGDARVVVEGEPAPSYSVYGSDPIVDLGLRHRPYFNDQTLTGLEPKDRFTVWVVIRPPEPLTSGRYSVTFYDTATDRSVLRIPVFIGGREGHHHEG